MAFGADDVEKLDQAKLDLTWKDWLWLVIMVDWLLFVQVRQM